MLILCAVSSQEPFVVCAIGYRCDFYSHGILHLADCMSSSCSCRLTGNHPYYV